jgi:hypothetical protein
VANSHNVNQYGGIAMKKLMLPNRVVIHYAATTLAAMTIGALVALAPAAMAQIPPQGNAPHAGPTTVQRNNIAPDPGESGVDPLVPGDTGANPFVFMPPGEQLPF